MKVHFRDVVKYCKECGVQLIITNTRDVSRKNFCSRSCSSSYNARNNITGMKGKKLTIEQRQKLSETRKRLGLAKGENNPRYKDGRRMFRNTILFTKDYVCCVCNKENEYLIAHHINPCNRINDRGRSPLDGDHSSENGVFMCASCHKKHHNYLKGLENVTSSAR